MNLRSQYFGAKKSRFLLFGGRLASLLTMAAPSTQYVNVSQPNLTPNPLISLFTVLVLSRILSTQQSIFLYFYEFLFQMGKEIANIRQACKAPGPPFNHSAFFNLHIS